MVSSSAGDALQEHLSLPLREAQAALLLFAHHAIADHHWQGTLELESVQKELEWMVLQCSTHSPDCLESCFDIHMEIS